MVSSHIIMACRVIPMAFFLAMTCPTVMVDVHIVYVGPEVSSNVTNMLTVHALGVWLYLSVYRYSGPPVVYRVCLLEFLGQGGNGCGEVGNQFSLRYHGLSVNHSCHSLMRALCIPSLSLRLFDPWYPPAWVDNFCLLLFFWYAAWKCAWKFAQVFFALPVLIKQARVVQYCVWCQRYLCRQSSVLHN